MATPTWLTSTQRIVGASHPQFTDTVNSVIQSMYATYLVEHQASGLHTARLTGLSGEVGSFSGNGAARTITLSNTGLTPKKIIVWGKNIQELNLVSNGGFDSATTGWSAGTGASIASVAGGQSGNCLEITYPNLITNPNFTSDTTGWTAFQSVLSSVAGGQAGNCLQVQGTGFSLQYGYQAFTTDGSSTYPVKAYVKQGSASNYYAIRVGTSHGSAAGGGSVGSDPGTAPATWTQYSGNITMTAATMYLSLCYNTANSNTMLYDTVSIANVNTDPDAEQTLTGLVSGETYTISCYVKSGTAGDENFAVVFDGAARITGTTTSSWVLHSTTHAYTGASAVLSLQNTGTTAGTMLFDTVSVTGPTGSAPIRIDTMGGSKAQPSRYSSDAWETDVIDNETAGSFDVENRCNESGTTNYYLVLGIDEDSTPTGDTGAGSDPTWITSSSANRLIADGTATISAANIGNNTQSYIWTQFIEEHTTAGVHSITLQDKRIETGNFSGNDADSRDIALTITDLDIAYICVYEDGMPVASKSTDMAGDTTKDEDAAAFAADLIQSIATNGQFQVGTALNVSGNTYSYIAIGV